jgi:hypothetical protein
MSARPILRALATAASLALVGLAGPGCNLVTGADSLVIGDGDDDAGTSDDDTSSGSDGSGSGSSGVGGGVLTGSSSSSSSTSGAGGGDTTPQPDMLGVEGGDITDIVLYQGVSRPLMSAGQTAPSTVPVVVNRPSLVRVFYQTDGAYNGQQVTARLSIDGQEPLEITTVLSGSSSVSDMGSTINFDVPGDMITSPFSYKVELLQPASMVQVANPDAVFPETGFDPVTVHTVGTLNITLVPIQYNGDGSGRMPDTSATQVQIYEDLFMGMYPVDGVSITVRAPLTWNNSVSADGNGWNALLDAVADLRQTDNAPSSSYYYGAFSPASSMAGYCSGGCVAGLGFLPGANDAFARAAIGLGFSGVGSAETAVHELGHNHGREHAPCNTSGDPNFPHQGGGIGVWGYDVVAKTLYNPANFVDMMSYCNPTWISDYNFGAIFERMQLVNNSNIYIPPELVNRTYERVRVNTDGSLSWLAPIQLERPPVGEDTAVTMETHDGVEATTGQLIRYDHLDGGMLFVPPASGNRTRGQALSVQLDGRVAAIGQ